MGSQISLIIAAIFSVLTNYQLYKFLINRSVNRDLTVNRHQYWCVWVKHGKAKIVAGRITQTMQLWKTGQHFLDQETPHGQITSLGVALYSEKKNESWQSQANLFIAKVNTFCLRFYCISAELSVNYNSKKACKNLGGDMEKVDWSPQARDSASG